eukprot:364999-Chlamydomonas_euryale.AAC.35
MEAPPPRSVDAGPHLCVGCGAATSPLTAPSRPPPGGAHALGARRLAPPQSALPQRTSLRARERVRVTQEERHQTPRRRPPRDSRSRAPRPLSPTLFLLLVAGGRRSPNADSSHVEDRVHARPAGADAERRRRGRWGFRRLASDVLAARWEASGVPRSGRQGECTLLASFLRLWVGRGA